MAPAAAQRGGGRGDDGKPARVAELLGMLEWAAYDRLQPVQLTLMEQLAALGEAIPEKGPLAQRLFLAGLDEVAASAETPDDFDQVLQVLDSHPEVFEALGREGQRQLEEARVAVMRQGATAALRACFPQDIEDPGVDPRELSANDVDLLPYWAALDKYFPKDPATPGSALRGRASPAAGAAAAAAAASRMTTEEQDEAFRKELMRNARRELNSVTDGAAPCVAKCQVVLGRARKPAFVADIRAMTKHVEHALLGKPAPPRPERGQDPAAVGRRLEGSVSHWPQGKSAATAAPDFQKQSRGHMRTLLLAAAALGESDSDDEDKMELQERGGGRGWGGRGPRYNDPSRPGRAVSFEDSQYHGEEDDTDSDSDSEDDGAPIDRRRPPASKNRAAAAATRRASNAAKRRREAEQEEGDSDQDEEVGSGGGGRGRDLSDSEGGGGVKRKGKKGGKPYAGAGRKQQQVGSRPILGVSRRAVPKRKRVAWGDEEVQALENAVENGFMGDWAGILKHRDYRGQFHESRTSVDLKDKWRNLERAKNRVAT